MREKLAIAFIILWTAVGIPVHDWLAAWLYDLGETISLLVFVVPVATVFLWMVLAEQPAKRGGYKDAK